MKKLQTETYILRKSDCHLHVVRRGQRTTQVFSFETCDMAGRSCVQTVRPTTRSVILVVYWFTQSLETTLPNRQLHQPMQEEREGGAPRLLPPRDGRNYAPSGIFLDTETRLILQIRIDLLMAEFKYKIITADQI